MSAVAPPPLTPPDSDLQDFPFMPLHVARLRDSDMASEAPPEACWYGVLLWAASWHQLPAGSLPDNDAILTKLIGLGRDVRTFAKHKDAAMRGFIRCSDGRLYHPVVAEQVLAAWTSKLQQRWRTELARIKKHNQRNGLALPYPTFEQFVSGQSPACPDHVPGDSDDCHSGQGIQGTGTGTGKAKEDPLTPLEGEGPKETATAEDAPPARRKPKHKIPDGFPTAQDVAEAQAKAAGEGADADMAYQAQRFRNWALGGDHLYADWPRTWANWVLRTIKEAPKRARSSSASAPADPLDRWRRAMRSLKASQYWNTTDFGPKPGKPGCLVPAAILAEFGFDPPAEPGPAHPFPAKADRSAA